MTWLIMVDVQIITKCDVDSVLREGNGAWTQSIILPPNTDISQNFEK